MTQQTNAELAHAPRNTHHGANVVDVEAMFGTALPLIAQHDTAIQQSERSPAHELSQTLAHLANSDSAYWSTVSVASSCRSTGYIFEQSKAKKPRQMPGREECHPPPGLHSTQAWAGTLAT
ncbi:hypothetical protein ACEPT7_09170 [Burkholderia ubonensis]|uniref:hypothetical protein n=1 Tax=Burkholderia ubonensis TaxID=101571 RepID=UPI00358DE98A